MPSDVFETLSHLKKERYRAAIFHAPPEKSSSLTAFSQKICRKMGGKYIDLLDIFIQNPSLCEKVDSFGVEHLTDWIIEQSEGQPMLVIDRIDFLLDKWSNGELQAFYRLITEQWDGLKASMKSTLIFCLQTSSSIEEQQILDSQKQSRVFRLNDFNDID